MESTCLENGGGFLSRRVGECGWAELHFSAAEPATLLIDIPLDIREIRIRSDQGSKLTLSLAPDVEFRAGVVDDSGSGGETVLDLPFFNAINTCIKAGALTAVNQNGAAQFQIAAGKRGVLNCQKWSGPVRVDGLLACRSNIVFDQYPPIGNGILQAASRIDSKEGISVDTVEMDNDGNLSIYKVLAETPHNPRRVIFRSTSGFVPRFSQSGCLDRMELLGEKEGTLWMAYFDGGNSTVAYTNCILRVSTSKLGFYNTGGSVILGSGTTLDTDECLIGYDHNFNPNLKNQLTIGEGAEVSVSKTLYIGYSRGFNGEQVLAVEGGSLLATNRPISICHGNKRSFLWLREGEISAKGIAVRDFYDPGYDFNVEAWRSEAFVMNGGRLNLGGEGISTLRSFGINPNVCLNGGILFSTDDWSTRKYQHIRFGAFLPQFDPGATNGTFTLDLAGKRVNFDTALDGGASVILKGSGSLISDPGPQGILSGPWRVESTGTNELCSVAAFKGGLTLADHVSAAVRIEAPSRYVRVGTFLEGDVGKAKEWHRARSDNMRIWVSGSLHELLMRQNLPTNNVFSCTGSFYVENPGVYSFAGSYGDWLSFDLDKTSVLKNSDENISGRNEILTGEVYLNDGWHTFKLTARHGDAEGSAGPQGEWKAAGRAIGWKFGPVPESERNNPLAYNRFDTDSFPMRLDNPNERMKGLGVINGLSLGEHAHLANRAASACEIRGKLEGSGKLSGPFVLKETLWDIQADSSLRKLPCVAFGEDSVSDALSEVGEIRITFDREPKWVEYGIGPSLGLEAFSREERDAVLSVYVRGKGGEPEPGRGEYTLSVKENNLVLRVLSNMGSVLILQ